MIKDIVDGFQLPKGIAGIISLVIVTAWITYVTLSVNWQNQADHIAIMEAITDNRSYTTAVESNMLSRFNKLWTIDNMKTLYASKDWHNNTNLSLLERRSIINEITKDQ